uniref:Uncharacterized protein n=1 Tax=Oryza punctata TaxID=4537 RepID=A0A0E0LDT1_ORYPU
MASWRRWVVVGERKEKVWLAVFRLMTTKRAKRLINWTDCILPTRSAAARITPSTSCGMWRSAPPASPHPARTPTLAMYLCTSERIISCIAAANSGVNGYCVLGAPAAAEGGGGGGGEGDDGSSWKWLWALSWLNRWSIPGRERESEVRGSSSCRRLMAQSTGSNAPVRATGRKICPNPPLPTPWLRSLRSDPEPDPDGLSGVGLNRLHGRSTTSAASATTPVAAAPVVVATASLRLREQFQWFLTALSFRAPCRSTSRRNASSSSGLHGPLILSQSASTPPMASREDYYHEESTTTTSSCYLLVEEPKVREWWWWWRWGLEK